MTKSRALASCPCVVYIVYTPGPHAESSGYEAWLRKVDNPFFNAIPGIRHYANWRIERVAGGQELDYAYLDFQGLDSADDLERVWFNPDLDRFRVEWVRLWGYAGAVPLPVQAHAYLMRPIRPARGVSRDFARITGGRGTAPTGTDLAWTVDEVITRHFALAGSGPWRRPAASDNPLGLDWLTLDYRDSIDDASSVVPPTADIAFAARCMAGRRTGQPGLRPNGLSSRPRIAMDTPAGSTGAASRCRRTPRISMQGRDRFEDAAASIAPRGRRRRQSRRR